MSRCILHVGMHKTGTTSIQGSLDRFRDEAFFYADLMDTPNHSLPIYTLFSDKPEKHHMHVAEGRSLEEVNAYKDQVERDLRNSIDKLRGRDLIISGEDISAMGEKEISRLKDYLDQYFDEIRVVGSVRPPGGYIASAFQQRLKGNTVNFHPDRLYREYRPSFEKFDAVFGRAKVDLYKFDPKNFVGNCAVREFCARVGIDFSLSKVIRLNESFSKQFVCLLYVYRQYSKKLGFAPIYGPATHKLSESLAAVGNDKFRFSPQLVREIVDKKPADMEWIEERIGASLRDDLSAAKEGDIASESDLLDIPQEVVQKMLTLLGDAVPPGVTGDGPEEIAKLVNAFRVDPAVRQKPLQKQDQNDPPIKRSTVARKKGRIVCAETSVVAGWAIGRDPEVAIQVALFINGNEVSRSIANKPRPALKERGIHPTGKCGFVFRAGDELTFQIGDEVQVKPVSEAFPIINSPVLVKESVK